MYGLIQSPPDSRDWNYAAVVASTPIPGSWVYPDTPLRDQGPHGTCVGFGSANMKDIQEQKDSQMQASALHIYRESKKIDGLPVGTEGTTLKAALSVLTNLGVCPEEELPYSRVSDPTATPTCPAEEIAKGKINGYARCYTVEDIKQALYKDGPVLIGVGITTPFRDLGPGEHHVTTLFGGQILGGHCMAITGYDDKRQARGKTGFFRLKNSWADWGEGGYVWLAYDVVTERSDMGMGLFMEAWSAVDLLTGFDGNKIEMWIGQTQAFVNGEARWLDSPPTIINGRTLVPVRFIAESLGCEVDWAPESRRITLTQR